VDDDETTPPAGAGRAHRAAAAATGASPGPADGARTSLLARGQALLSWVQRTRPARANARFGSKGGGVLTGGIAYAALFSVFAALTIGWTVFMAVLGGDVALRGQVLDAIDATLPGLVDTGDGRGLIDPASLRLTPGLSVTGAVAIVVLVLSALSAMAALRTGVRAMFDDENAVNAVAGKLSELAAFAGMAAAVLLSAVLTTGVSAAARWLLDGLGLGAASTVALHAASLLVAFVVDAGTFLLVVWVLGGQRPPWRDLAGGAAIAAVGIGLVRVLGTSVVAGSADRNPLLASFAVVVTLLVWVNLIARIVLLGAAWVADPPHHDAPETPKAAAREGERPPEDADVRTRG
jgi:membrane protein